MDRTSEYRYARDAQDRRFEAANGSVSITDTSSQEYRDYFGVGDCRGTGVETRLTYKSWLIANKAEVAPVTVGSFNDSSLTRADVFTMSGAELAELAACGSQVAAGEITRRAINKAAKVAARRSVADLAVSA